MNQNRVMFDDTMAAMFSNHAYEKYLFYAHIIGSCSIKIRKDLDAPAAVSFVLDHYNLYINPDTRYIPLSHLEHPEQVPEKDIVEIDGEKNLISQGFDDFPLEQRLAILKHEALHILNGHLLFMDDKNISGWNYATDCAINQFIEPLHINEKWITPKTLGEMLDIKIPLMKDSDTYYQLLKKHAEELDPDMNGQPNSHKVWGESEGDEVLQKEITRKMIMDAQDNTVKQKGPIPDTISEWLTINTNTSELNWKKVLRGIVGSKRVGRIPTVKRRNRRFPDREDIRGIKKDRMFNLLVIADVSGSMSNHDVLSTLGEVRHICDVTGTAVDLIQIDAEAYEPEKLKKTTAIIERKGNGGTNLYPAIEKAKESNIQFDAVVVLTDGGLYSGEVELFNELHKKVIWLVSHSGTILENMEDGKMKAFQLKE